MILEKINEKQINLDVTELCTELRNNPEFNEFFENKNRAALLEEIFRTLEKNNEKFYQLRDFCKDENDILKDQIKILNRKLDFTIGGIITLILILLLL